MDEQKSATAIDVVTEFLAALERTDVNGARELLHPDVVYQNVPFPPARGRDAVEKQLRALERYFNGFEVIHHNIAANGSTVLTERTDVLVVGPVRAAFWVCGTFEIRDGQIALWRDRFDFLDVTWAFIRGTFHALMARHR